MNEINLSRVNDTQKSQQTAQQTQENQDVIIEQSVEETDKASNMLD